jgi:hypothetical protein
MHSRRAFSTALAACGCLLAAALLPCARGDGTNGAAAAADDSPLARVAALARALWPRLEVWAQANQTEAFLAGFVVLALVNLALGARRNRRRFLDISDALFAPDPSSAACGDGDGGDDNLAAAAAAASGAVDPSSLSFLARHFAGHGHARCRNPSLWWRESLSHAVLWASGRRGLDGCLVAVEIAPRQDLLHRLGLLQLAAATGGGASLEPREGDILLPGSSGEGLLLDAFVDADAMPWQGAVVVGARWCLRALAKKYPVDVGAVAQAHAIDPQLAAAAAAGGGGGGGGAGSSSAGGAGAGAGAAAAGGDPRRLPYAWPSADLAVLTDQPALFQALFASPRVAALLSDPERAALVRRHLRFLYVTSAHPGRNARRVLAEVKLPASSARLRDAEPALELVMAVVDALPSFRQSPEALRRAEESRAAANEAAEARRKGAAGGGGGGAGGGAHDANQRRMMERRQERLAQERDKARREGKLDEWERQQRLKEQKKLAKKRTMRVG